MGAFDKQKKAGGYKFPHSQLLQGTFRGATGPLFSRCRLTQQLQAEVRALKMITGNVHESIYRAGVHVGH